MNAFQRKWQFTSASCGDYSQCNATLSVLPDAGRQYSRGSTAILPPSKAHIFWHYKKCKLQAIWKLFFNKHLCINMKRLILHFISTKLKKSVFSIFFICLHRKVASLLATFLVYNRKELSNLLGFELKSICDTKVLHHMNSTGVSTTSYASATLIILYPDTGDQCSQLVLL